MTGLRVWLTATAILTTIAGGAVRELTVDDTFQVPVRENKSLPLCRQSSDLWPGNINANIKQRLTWEPEHCELKAFGREATRKCLKTTKIVLFGDSLTESYAIHAAQGAGLVKHENERWEKTWNWNPTTESYKREGKFWKVSESEETARLSHFWAPGFSLPASRDLRKHPVAIREIREADVVVLSGAMWDMGRYYCGITTYLDSAIARINEVKLLLKPTARISIFGLHWLDINRMSSDKNNIAYLCNKKQKAEAFREALYLAAACTNVGVLNVKNITREALAAVDVPGDGIHFPASVNVLPFDVLLNSCCRSPRLLIPSPVSCDDRHHFIKKWASSPEVNMGCEPDRLGDSITRCPLSES
eukprot:TRINITY_DN3690_c0_g2_i3.p1 TRINITY_DN3690_c0_g2~~TRINITY_DN3690_c0_g2_i3.p1  ORF type:complete len:360 (+),score=63.02 TRINITY_DN3690_c0_g2_i3:47-1126(+)